MDGFLINAVKLLIGSNKGQKIGMKLLERANSIKMRAFRELRVCIIFRGVDGGL